MGKRKVYGELLTPSGIIGPTTADLVIQLGDAAGTYALSIVDSATAEVADINSDGALTCVKATVSSGLGVTGASTFSGALTVAGTLTGSSNMSITGTGTVSGTFTASSSGLVSGGLTVSKTITGSSNASVAGTLTASSSLSANQGVTVARAVASSAANLVSYGLIDITATGAANYVIDAPVAGRDVYIFKTANSTAAATVTVNATGTVTFDGTNTVLTFNGQNQVAHLMGNSATRWLLISTTGQVGGIA